MKLKLKDRIKRYLESKAGVWFVWTFVVYFWVGFLCVLFFFNIEQSKHRTDNQQRQTRM